MPRDLLEAAMGGCDVRAVELLRERARLCVFDKADTLYSQGDPSTSIYLILDGCIIVERTSVSGDITSYRIVARGDFLGHRSFFAGESRSTTPRCITPSRAYHISRTALDEAIAVDGTVSLHLARELARDDGPRLGAVVRSQRIVGIVRLAYLLLHLHDKLAPENGLSTDSVQMPFNQHDLANMLDVRNETISRLLHQLQDMGVVTVLSNPRRIAIIDRPALNDFISDYL